MLSNCCSTFKKTISLRSTNAFSRNRNASSGSGQLNSERNPATVANQMTLAAQLGPVSRIRPRLRPPKTARIELPSTTARDQSLCP